MNRICVGMDIPLVRRHSVNEELGSSVMVNYLYNFVHRIRNDQRGLTAVEYAVLGGIIVAGLVAVGSAFEDQLTGAFSNLFTKVTAAQNG